MTSARLLSLALAVVLTAVAPVTPTATGSEGPPETTPSRPPPGRLAELVERLRARERLEGLRQLREERLASREPRTEPEDDPSLAPECRGIGQAREPRVGISPAAIPQLGRVIATVLRFDAQPGVGMAAQVARCLYMPLAGVGR